MAVSGHKKTAERSRLDDLGALVLWAPIVIVGVVALLIGGWGTLRLIDYFQNAVPGGVSVDTQGATGEIREGRVFVTLPLVVYNATPLPVLRVSLWTEVFACPGPRAPLAACTRLLSAAQDVPMQVGHNSAGHFIDHMESGLPDRVAGRSVRVLRELREVETQSDHDQSGLFEVPIPDDPGQADQKQ